MKPKAAAKEFSGIEKRLQSNGEILLKNTGYEQT